jgi:SPOR domain
MINNPMKFIKMAMPIVLSAILLGLCTSPLALGQASIVRNRLQSLAMGKLDEVKRDLPDLLAEFPDDPGVQFLHASVLEDMSKSLPMYQRIVKEQPDCEWSDDAQWRIVHYYAMKRDTAKAREEMQNFRSAYPKSELLLTAYDLLRATVGGAGKMKKQEVKQYPKTEPKSDPKAEPKKDVKEGIKTPSSSQNLKTGKDDGNLIVSGNDTEMKPNRNNTLFTLQIGVFKTKAAAQEEFNEYKSKRMKVNLMDRKMPDGSFRYVVTIGEYTSRKNAEAGVALVKDVCNCTPLIIQKLDQ